MTAVREQISGLGTDLKPSAEEKAALGSMVSDISTDLKKLVQQEVALAQAEIKAEVSKIGKGAGMLAGAVLAALMVLIFLSTALWWALANIMDQSWAAMIVAAVWLAIGAILFVVGRGALRSISLKPERTLASLKQIPGAFAPKNKETSS